MNRRVLYVASTILISFLISSCWGGSNKKKSESTKEEKKEIGLVIPTPPSVLSEHDKMEYLALHFWDNYDFTDTTYLSHKDMTEQFLVDFLGLINNVSLETGEKALITMLKKSQADSDVFDHYSNFYDSYLGDPSSPMRNEDLYIPYLRFVIESEKIDSLEKIRPKARLELSLKNRVGDKANDIRATLSSGATVSLYGIKSEYTLLYFINPDCSACAATTEDLKNSPNINALIDDKLLTIMLVYPDTDLTAWREHLSDIPSKWINGYDKEQVIREKETYDLEAIPSLYLLDKDKRVIIKDAPASYDIVYYFNSI